jgi:hypothetical protein
MAMISSFWIMIIVQECWSLRVGSEYNSGDVYGTDMIVTIKRYEEI